MLGRFRIVVLGVLLAALMPATAGAQSDAAPPGNSAVDQYRESVPAPDGPRRSLSERERSQLARQGPDGKALAEAIERQGGVAAAGTDADAPGAGGRDGSAGDAAGKRSPRGDDRDVDADADTAAGASSSGTDGGGDDRGVVGMSTSAVGDQLPLGWMAAIAVLLATVGVVRWRRA